MTEGKKVYSIKPLEWEGEEPAKDEDGFPRGGLTAKVPFGSYDIHYAYEEHEEGERGLVVDYCFTEYFDDGQFPCDSLEDGKKKAEAHWHERILPALVEVMP